MIIPLIVLLFMIGISVGSFLNLLSDRLPLGEPVLVGRSKCDDCKRTLRALELIPGLGYFFLRGRCSCKKIKLSPLYPISEFITGIVFAFIGYYVMSIYPLSDFRFYISLSFLICIFSVYIAIFLTDIKYQLIPDVLIVFGVFTTVFFTLLMHGLELFFLYTRLSVNALNIWYTEFWGVLTGLGLTLLSSVLITLFFIGLILITKGRGMGGGDMKLSFLIGLFNGFYFNSFFTGFSRYSTGVNFPNNVLAIFLSFIIGAVFSLILMGLSKKTSKDIIPFGPFMVLGSVIAYFGGNQLLLLYWSINL